LACGYVDALFKGHQMRYYARMRDIELAAYQLNSVALPERRWGIATSSSTKSGTTSAIRARC
jgi:hypothetical protein